MNPNPVDALTELWLNFGCRLPCVWTACPTTADAEEHSTAAAVSVIPEVPAQQISVANSSQCRQ